MTDPRKEPKLGPPRGIVAATARNGGVDGRRVAPSPDLAPFIHHYWLVEWRLRSPFVADTLQHPAARITFEEHRGLRRSEIAGVRTGQYSKALDGSGRWFGIQFRPATFQPLLRASMATLTDRVASIEDVFASEGSAWADALYDEPALERKIAAAEAFLRPRLRPLRSTVLGLRNLCERMAVDRSLLRVEAAADALAIDTRSLQRRFRRYVGVSPKWVIRRYRLHEAIEQLRAEPPPKLAELAASLGYSDQAHFAREVMAVVGRTPGSLVPR